MRLALAAIALLVLACGAAGAGEAAPAAAPSVALTVVFDAGPSRAATRSTLRCTGTRASGTGRLRDVASRACRTARARHAVLHGGAARADEVCTELYGGPQTARVTGTLGRSRVARSFSREDGCRISEWDALVPLLPRTRGVSGP